MTPTEAIRVLDIATQPRFEATRADFANIQAALVVLSNLVEKTEAVDVVSETSAPTK